ncbi:MAG: PQQ-binding-like beta-propeller repeat protein [Verrucomicrobia bacterium]|nr:PQQ-binding-like beta-propeller repeat protein [Verrucomicrobiota bacterium]
MSNSRPNFRRWNQWFCLLAALAWPLTAAVAELPGTKLWEYDTGGTYLTAPALAENGMVYFCFTISNTVTGPGGNLLTHVAHKLSAILEDGSRQWEVVIPVRGNVVIGDGQTLFLSGKQSQATTIALPGGVTATTVTTTNGLFALNTDGTIRWQRPAPDDFALGADGNLNGIFLGRNVFATNSTNDPSGFTLAAIQPDGQPQWEIQSSSNSVGATGAVLSVSPSGVFHLAVLTPFSTTNVIPGPGGRSITTITSGAGPLNAIATETMGIRLLSTGRLFSSPVFSARGEALAPSRLLVTNLVVQTIALPGGGTTNVTTLQPGLSPQSSFCAFDSSGQLLWDSGVTSSNFSPAVVAADGTIYVGSVESNLYAISASGALKWQFAAGAAITASPALAGDGTIYFGTEAGMFYALTTNATVDWQFTVGGPICGAPVIGPTGVVYFGSDDGKLYAFQGWAALARSPWPMFRHDPTHTGRAFQVGLHSERPATNGTVQLRLNLEKNASYRLESSTNLVNWQPWTNVTSSTGGVLRVNAPINSGTERKFYRLQGTP